MRRRVFVVGTGAVAAPGENVAGFWSALLLARTGLRPLDRYEMDGFPAKVAAPVERRFEQYCPPCPWRQSLSAEPERRNARLFAAAVGEAAASCGWLDTGGATAAAPVDVAPERRGLYAAIRGEESEALLEALASRAPGGVRVGAGTLLPSFPLRVARDLGVGGAQLLLHDACTTGTALLGEAFHDLRDGVADLALVAAANADLTLDTLCHYALLAALSPGLSTDACRPFDPRRDGFVRGEGSGALILVASDGDDVPDTVLAEIAGYGASADAYRPTAGHPEERGLVLALSRCLSDAGISPEAVDHINAHGTGTKMNDLHEARALHRVLGERVARIPLTANKAVSGHVSFASGLMEAIASVETLRSGTIPPIAGSERLDPELPPLDLVLREPRRVPVETALSLSSAFGGLNAALLLRRV